MPIRNIIRACRGLAFVFLFCAFGSNPASAQTPAQTNRQPQQRPTVIMPNERAPAPAARESELACGGLIGQAPATSFEIVGGLREPGQRVFAEGDNVFINAGSQEGLQVGQEFSVVRPRGRFESKFTRKRGPLGIYTQEVGRVRVTRLKDHSSVAQVVRSCDNLLNGDLLVAAAQRVSPVGRAEVNLDRFAGPTGKQTGRIVLARDAREMISRDQVVFIDLGVEDNLKVGDYLTIFRPIERGTLVHDGDEITANARRGYESDQFRGGKFSNQAQRLKDTDGSIYSETVKTPEIRERRPAVPRHIVGEMVVLHVEGRTATAVITRVAEEIHTGDYVEIQ